MSYRLFVRQILVVLGVGCVMAAYPLYTYPDPRLAFAVAVGAAICTANVLVGCFSAVWAFDRSDAAFFKALFGGMLARMAGIGVAFVVLIKFTDLHVSALTLSLFFFYVLFQVLEIRFLVKHLAARREAREG